MVQRTDEMSKRSGGGVVIAVYAFQLHCVINPAAVQAKIEKRNNLGIVGHKTNVLLVA